MVADDTKFWREKISTILSHSGLEVLEAESGEEAIRLCSDPARPVDLLVLDLVMPGTDGFEVVRQLRARKLTADLPIVAITSVFKPEQFPHGCQALGLDTIVEKAASSNQLLFIFNKYLNRDRAPQRPAPRIASFLPGFLRAGKGPEVRCVITNLSCSGAFVGTMRPLQLGSELCLLFSLPEDVPICAFARVVWVNDGDRATETGYSRGMGVVFKDLEAAVRRALAAYVKSEIEKG